MFAIIAETRTVFLKLKALATLSVSVDTFVMAHINSYLHNPQQASASYPFSRIDTSVNADPDAWCGSELKSVLIEFLNTVYDSSKVFCEVLW